VTTLVTPPADRVPWPTLGPQVCRFIEEELVFGPGDLLGQPARLDDEQRGFIFSFYEVHPRGTPKAGRRRFRRGALFLRKGSRKTELAAWIAAVEAHPEGPVRCGGFRRIDGHWEPVGGPVIDPYIPMLAYTEEQSEELAYGALYQILSRSRVVDDFDIGLDRIVRARGDGKVVPLANAPEARDGARTTFQHKDETGRWRLPRQRDADRVTRSNLLKRPLADPWELETTLMYEPGAGSVAESTHDYAKLVASGAIKDSGLFFFMRSASEKHDLTTPDGVRAAVLEASGPLAAWSDIDGIVSQFFEPDADPAWLARAWLMQGRLRSEKAFDAERWKDLADPDHVVPPKAVITIGFDGAKTRDATSAVATEVSTGYQWPLGVWPGVTESEQQDLEQEVDVAIDEAFTTYTVAHMYADPPYWKDSIAHWQGRYGEEIVVRWETWRPRPMARAVLAYANAIGSGELHHSGDATFAAHVGAAFKRPLSLTDDQGTRLWTVQKERPDSPHKIDAAVAGLLSWEARADVIAAGALQPAFRSAYETERLTFAGGTA